MVIIKSPLGVGEEKLKGGTAKAFNFILLINAKTVHFPWGYSCTCTLKYHLDSGV